MSDCQDPTVFEISNEPELTEEIHTHAGLLYQELEVLVQTYGQDVIANLLPHIIQVLENLDSTKKDNYKYLDTINALSTDNEQLAQQYEEEKMIRKEREEDLIRAEENYDQEVRKLNQEIDNMLQQNKQLHLRLVSTIENLKRSDERYETLESEEAELRIKHLENLQLLENERSRVGRRRGNGGASFKGGFEDSVEEEEFKRRNLPKSYQDFAPTPRLLKQKKYSQKSKDAKYSRYDSSLYTNDDQKSPIIDLTTSLTTSSEFDGQSEMVSSFAANKKSLAREVKHSNRNRNLGADVFVFKATESSSDDGILQVTPGKKRKAISLGSVQDVAMIEVNDKLTSPLFDTPSPEATTLLTINNARIEDYTPAKSMTSLPNPIIDGELLITPEQDSRTNQSLTDTGSDVSELDNQQDLRSRTETFKLIIDENSKLREEKCVLSKEKNKLLDDFASINAEFEFNKDRIKFLEEAKEELENKKIELEAEIKRNKNTLADQERKNENNQGSEVFFGFTRTEMAQVLRERNEFKVKYFALKQEYGALEARKNKRSGIWRLFVNLFKRERFEEDVRPVSVIVPNFSNKTIDDELYEITQHTSRFIFEEDADPYCDALASQRATFVPYLRNSPKEDTQDRVDAYGWTLPKSMFQDCLEESVRSGSSECSLPPQVAALACCRPVSYQEEGAKLWCAVEVGEVMGNISSFNSSTTAALIWVCWGVPNLTKLSIVDASSTEVLETFPVCASPLLTIAFIPGVPEHVCNFNMHKPSTKLATMWMGGDSGCLYIHSALTAWDKCLYALRLQSSITDIKYAADHVLAALTNGTIEVFNRTALGEWDWDNHISVNLGKRRDFPVLCLLPTFGRIWAGIGNNARIINEKSYKEEHVLMVHYKVTCQVTFMERFNYGVWVSVRQESTLRLYHLETYDHLQDIDMSPKIHALLHLPHYAALIRITALHVSNNCLWIGTDHGAILSIPFSDNHTALDLRRNSNGGELNKRVSLSNLSLHSDDDHPLALSPKHSFTSYTSSNANNNIQSHSPFCSIEMTQLSFHGHTGPVRFILTSSKTVARHDSYSSHQGVSDLFTPTCLVVSGGEGHIDYRTSEGAITGGPDMPRRDMKDSSDPTVLVTDRNYFIVWYSNNKPDSKVLSNSVAYNAD